MVENDAYSAFLRRAIRAAGRRVAGGDVEGLADLLSLAGELDRATDAAVRGLRERRATPGARSRPGWE